MHYTAIVCIKILAISPQVLPYYCTFLRKLLIVFYKPILIAFADGIVHDAGSLCQFGSASWFLAMAITITNPSIAYLCL